MSKDGKRNIFEIEWQKWKERINEWEREREIKNRNTKREGEERNSLREWEKGEKRGR